jgi:hypothetical protein
MLIVSSTNQFDEHIGEQMEAIKDWATNYDQAILFPERIIRYIKRDSLQNSFSADGP